jgi:hypothetical protein
MSFRCTACWKKAYDKAWKLQRHVRESKNCFDQINLGLPTKHFVRFLCASCGYITPRELDLDRHRRRVHGADNAITSGSFYTSSADASAEVSAHVGTGMMSDLLQPEISHDRTLPVEALHSSLSLDGTYPRDLSIDPTDLFLASIHKLQSPSDVKTDEYSGKTGPFVSNSSPSSQAHIAKRKYSYHGRPPVDYKRFCADVDLFSNLGVQDVSTNESDVPEHDSDLGPGLEMLQDLWGLDSHPDKIVDEGFSAVLGSGERFEADSSFVKALANIDLTPTAEDYNIPTATETYEGDWVQYVLLRNEPQTLPSKNSVTFPGWTPDFVRKCPCTKRSH